MSYAIAEGPMGNHHPMAATFSHPMSAVSRGDRRIKEALRNLGVSETPLVMMREENRRPQWVED
jgi:SOS response regulatory protein OraA/RecX